MGRQNRCPITGSCALAAAMREDCREQLRKRHRGLGFIPKSAAKSHAFFRQAKGICKLTPAQAKKGKQRAGL